MKSGTKDQVDLIVAAWAREWPELDTSPAAIVGRVGRLAQFFDVRLERMFKPFGLTRAGFDVLAALRRSGRPYRLPQNVLMSSLMRGSGTMSFRIDRLERAGLVKREPDPDDKRGVFVRLTDKGQRVFDRLAPLHLDNEHGMLAALSRRERHQLTALLRKLLLSFETESS